MRNGSQIEENLAKMAMLIPSWAVLWAILAASWAVLGDVGSKMERNGAIRSAKRSHQRLPDGKDRGVWVVIVALWGP